MSRLCILIVFFCHVFLPLSLLIISIINLTRQSVLFFVRQLYHLDYISIFIGNIKMFN